MKTIDIRGLALAAVLGLATLTAAQATRSLSPLIGYVTWTSTGSVSANRTYHFVRVEVPRFTEWRVRDTANNVIVASGDTGWHTLQRSIFGLYGTYKASGRLDWIAGTLGTIAGPGILLSNE